ncbi:MAG: carbohydrate kinase family protein [Rhizobiales bacterium]|nr:carbohydrate kinase family protein [Hyphomicrobiales bacterium]
MTRRGILTGGTWCVDRNLLVDQWPAENGRADILDLVMNGGGSGCNLAIDIRKLDARMPVATICLVGDDADGHFLKAEAEENGVDTTDFMLIGEAMTDYTHAYSSKATGRRTHISYFGTSHLLTPDHFDFARSTHKYLHLGLPGIHRLMDAPFAGDANGWVTVLKKARTAGLKTNIELASIPGERLAALVRPCLPHLDLVVVNDAEIAGIAGIPVEGAVGTDPETCIRAAKIVLEMSAADLVVAHFPKGGVAVARDGSVTTKASVNVPPAATVGANGAGDAFAAGFLYGVHEGWSVERCLVLAHATAAASLRNISTTASVVPVAECLKLADQWGWRASLQ